MQNDSANKKEMLSFSASTITPVFLVFLVDFSQSMGENGESGRSRQTVCMDFINNSIHEILRKCRKTTGIKNWYYVCALHYEDPEIPVIENLLEFKEDSPEEVKQQIFLPASDFKFCGSYNHFADGVVEYLKHIPCRGGTPTKEALSYIDSVIRYFNPKDLIRKANPGRNFNDEEIKPRLVIFHLTDNRSDSTLRGPTRTDNPNELESSPLLVAKQIMSGYPEFKDTVLFNIHLSADDLTEPVLYPNKISNDDSYKIAGFELSSVLPSDIILSLQQYPETRDIESGAHACVCNLNAMNPDSTGEILSHLFASGTGLTSITQFSITNTSETRVV